MDEHAIPCTFMVQEVYGFTRPSYLSLTQRAWNDSLKTPLISAVKQIPYVTPVGKRILQVISPASVAAHAKDLPASMHTGDLPVDDVLNLQPGDRVRVRSLEEIRSTLDENGKYKGLLFMPEMKTFCGKEYHVFKQVRSITLESNGEVRKLRSPTVFLEGVYCDGKRHNNCDRSCLLFWREAWLKRI
ncbi:hypothetical protein FGU65_02230 [Methanoculleus sp. FWC-SCC1]|uniref:Uncharacterized protein n=1 Tax=Methanoculleus frigidifontis TaxID=2584085 RepID=A0ABT8M712_9EURY|nr:hypothetical protein [Methanoculleus sp. FWC-SCC1]MDN7023723.1 hypothetical protein [Methanoculleus sp. FWC-SCC1]